jgi:hypothetical protein
VTDVAHETQEACIDALHGEIARVREILEHSMRPGDRQITDEPNKDEQAAP